MLKSMDTYLRMLPEKGASDMHITAGAPISLRLDEDLVAVEKTIVTPEESKRLAYSILSDEQKEVFERDLELDISFGIEKIGRFRINVFKQRGAVGCAIRLIPFDIWSFEQCGLPVNVATDLCKQPKGLVLVTGATGSGKSTTLASMIDWINHDRPCHIMTIEDPIEFIHRNDKSIVNQRELGGDTHSFNESLRHVLRQDPDVIMIGEMRDLETIESALIIAETGHLVFSTIHTSDAVQTVNRIVDVFPAHQQQQIRTQLSFVLVGILSHQLVPTIKKPGRALATEILLATPAVRSLIRESKLHQLYSILQTSQKEGMKTMNQALYEMYQKRLITYEAAFERTSDPDDLKRIFKR